MSGNGCKSGCGAETSSASLRSVRSSADRRMIAAVLGVWALLIQALLPVAGAMASPAGDDFWGALCQSAGIETGFSETGSANGLDPFSSDHESFGAGCGACITCACASTNGCGCGSLSVVETIRLVKPNRHFALVDGPGGPPLDLERSPRAPPYA